MTTAITPEKVKANFTQDDQTIHKVKLVKDRIAIKYDRPAGSTGLRIDTDEIYPEPALASFHEALDDLLEDVIDICDLGSSWSKTGRVTGITFKYGDDGIGATITVQRKCDIVDSPDLKNTPFLSGAVLTDSQIDKLHAVIDETRHYLSGDRAEVQLDLFSGHEEEL
jgi:hypothetical protein